MTPYVVNEESDSPPAVSQIPKSIMVNGEPPDQLEKKAGTPESIASSSKSVTNGNGKIGKGTLKRVSFGSSKGSMVETLVYDHHEELPYLPPFNTALVQNNGKPANPPSKVRVSFFESQRPHYVTTPESPDVPLDVYLPVMSASSEVQSPNYERQQSVDGGIDNPFRPDGELSREADTIVSLIKEGKPITPVGSGPEVLVPATATESQEVPPAPEERTDHIDGAVSELADGGGVVPAGTGAPDCGKAGANGSAPKDAGPAEPGVVEVRRGIVAPPSDAPQVEQVVIKKKPKCKCCVIQ
ncbi:uncharacterized protein [Centruroides vittatus]|uniref:uncharacterized protein isoform X2 n=1 Tax=Centruroides vittatus TaxID=120091 RepID=UPI00351040E3